MSLRAWRSALVCAALFYGTLGVAVVLAWRGLCGADQ